MDMIIDRWGKKLFDDAEIDTICDAINNLLFKEFFEAENTLLSIQCTEESDNETARAIYCKNKVDPESEFEKLCYNYATRYFDDFYAKVFDYPVPQTESNAVGIGETTIYLYMISIKLESGYIYMYAGADCFQDIQSCSTSMFGLMLTVCKMLSYRDHSAGILADILTYKTIKNLEKTTQQAIVEKVNQLLSNHL